MVFENTVKDIRDVVDEETLLMMAYVPIYLQVMAFDMASLGLAQFTDMRIEEVKKECRFLKGVMKDQMKRYRFTLPDWMFDDINRNSKKFEESIMNDVTLYYFSYEQIFKNQFDDADKLSSAMAYMAISNDIMTEIMNYDKYVEDIINQKYFAQSREKYKHVKMWLTKDWSDNVHSIEQKLGYNISNINDHIRNARAILRKHVREIRIKFND